MSPNRDCARSDPAQEVHTSPRPLGDNIQNHFAGENQARRSTQWLLRSESRSSTFCNPPQARSFPGRDCTNRSHTLPPDLRGSVRGSQDLEITLSASVATTISSGIILCCTQLQGPQRQSLLNFGVGKSIHFLGLQTGLLCLCGELLHGLLHTYDPVEWVRPPSPPGHWLWSHLFWHAILSSRLFENLLTRADWPRTTPLAGI